MNEQAEGGKPWWREPWPWILMAGPAVAIVGCAITIVLALEGSGFESVNDGGTKRGLVVTKEPVKTDASIKDPTSVE
ncbi:hypothetical protein [Paracandidimonas soli]|uniref:Nitrogen fixation protein FixH n=1 Tax=Paracandidimonas soli TaxID=1917182 RepID=A0A4R3VCT8_9BURK|nr:hypothetical protein [Paracandidimonas soli]TCV01454.1 hypothetical protein EV686_102166 [Paracandidimonas soli]